MRYEAALYVRRNELRERVNEIEELNNAKSASEMTAGFERDHSESDALAGKHNSV